MTPRRSELSGDLFDQASSEASQEGEPGGTRHETSSADPTEPRPNSPDDLGFGKPARPPDVDRRPPRSRSYGSGSPGPDPVPQNVASGTIQIQDARKFVTWIHGQDFPIHEDVTVGHVLVALSGFTPKKLGWLCRACRQAGRAPAPWVMKIAAFKEDVGLLRPENEPEKSTLTRRREN